MRRIYTKVELDYMFLTIGSIINVRYFNKIILDIVDSKIILSVKNEIGERKYSVLGSGISYLKNSKRVKIFNG